jgi:hydrogenase maturation protein HypF
MLLEAAINKNIHDYYPFNYKDGVIDFSSVFRALIDDLIKNKHVDIISSKFHNTISEIVVYVCKEIFNKTGIDRIALSGGTFQNRYLLSQVENKLKRLKFKVYSNESVPSNDGGIALGQLAIAAKRRII